MKLSNPHPTHDGVSTDELVYRAARALLENSYVALGDREYVFEADYLADLHPADVAYILDSDCTCHQHYAGGEYVEVSCERCRLEQHRQSVPFDLESER